MPKFKSNNNLNLNNVFFNMGIKTAFDPIKGGDFRKMTIEEPTYISKILQGNSFEVDENGIAGASATVVEMMTGGIGARPQEYIRHFHLTRPFLYIVTETNSGAILFVGKVTKL